MPSGGFQDRQTVVLPTSVATTNVGGLGGLNCCSIFPFFNVHLPGLLMK